MMEGFTPVGSVSYHSLIKSLWEIQARLSGDFLPEQQGRQSVNTESNNDSTQKAVMAKQGSVICCLNDVVRGMPFGNM